MQIRHFLFAIPLAFAPVEQASAHHSFAMFDQTRQVTVTGKVKEFEWVNPHSWIHLLVVNPKTNKAEEYSFEMGGTLRSVRDGWKADTIKPGDTLTVTMLPLKDGSRGGMYFGALLANGKQLGRSGPAVACVTKNVCDVGRPQALQERP
jgi:hypothetical protein